MIILAFLIGIVAGLRALTPLAVTSWAAHLGWLQLKDTWLAFLGFAATSYIVTALALGELITDKLPRTPSRKVPLQFGTRIVSGALCGAALGIDAGAMLGGAFAGAVGAVVGTLGGAALRTQAARMFGKDLPAALLEDVVAIGGALLIISRFA
jgi:uncharacterized membrane protein